MAIKDIDLQRVLHIRTVGTFYAAIVEGYFEWRTAVVEAVVRAELPHRHPAPPGGTSCASAAANLRQVASSYREGREWSCECHYCRLLAGVRNYLAHHWGRGHAAFAISAGRPNAVAIVGRQDHTTDTTADGSEPCRYAPQVDIELVSKRLKERRKFDAAARVLGKGARRFNLAPAVEGCLRCLSTSHALWRLENPLPADDPHDCPGADLVELTRQRRQTSVGRGAGTSRAGGGTRT